MQIKFLLNIKKKLNNNHYKLNVFLKNIQLTIKIK